MPTVRKFVDAKEKYELKYDGTNVTARLTAVGDIKNRRYEAGMSPVYNIQEQVRQILESSGVPAGQHALYYAFAQVLVKFTFSHSGPTLDLMISGKKAEWITAHKADAEVLDKIVLTILGKVPPY